MNERTHDTARKMVEYFDGDAPRVDHAFKVLGYAVAIAATEKLSDAEREALEYAAILHDIGIKESERKYGSAAPKHQEVEGPPVARAILETVDAAPEIVDRVCFIVSRHHTYDAVDGTDFRILVEADFIVNLREGWVPLQDAASVRDRYFRTSGGRALIESLFLRG